MPESNHISPRRLIAVASAAWLLLTSDVGLAASPAIIAVRTSPSPTHTRLTIESSTPLKFKQLLLANPNRLVIDVEGVQLNNPLKSIGSQISSNDPLVHSARVSRPTPKTARLVLDLKTEVKPQVFALKPDAKFKNRLVVDLFPTHAHNDPLLALLVDDNKGRFEFVDPPASEPAHPKLAKASIVHTPVKPH
ncbi:AMIN domain-containing protein [Crenobacter sp. SG2305]|uniref:AMIN domain-containing protein n=1 Tax=Crenobacter oryzisoli TaxID=3056844 RepID=UPI0025AA4161|nr:AMIN domain-containing protein [Crenobacter sp. SG2305]MDN0082173.1 AMIN domain-containing protein [Crenobacter sp. SG2305]